MTNNNSYGIIAQKKGGTMENLEMKIYEKLGVKKFKNFVLNLNVKATDNKKIKGNNYYLDQGHGLEDLKKFKLEILFNGYLHTYSSIACIVSMMGSIIPIALYPILIATMTLNTYCIMLQRYNWIRIKKAIKKNEPLEERKKEKIKQELQEQEDKLLPHTYKTIKNFKIPKEVSFDKLIEDASLEDLKRYRKSLNFFGQISDKMKADQTYYDNTINREIDGIYDNGNQLKVEFITEDSTERLKIAQKKI